MMHVCQSCGMPMNKDPEGGGSEADGVKSTTYCSYCYGDGDFLAKDVTAQEFQAVCVEKMSEHGWWKPLAWLFTRGIPKLERWRS
ncbi:MAG: hypothetical protein COA52_02985 [Hyphomicrobiales bacterium]|nr:MAG: hypothetical protein COA52_02985 [Hyphomicrobiales bacterium]